ncbi:acylphosphatase [Vagococcus fluvialis]|uniref:acylphosphatase n=1 Tax=Vagococcus fluvialis TaxID=2738 RepID=A0A369B059_9ENTE|nr:acylphosphatase [Vagococcus fluvialis]MBO0488021.1 acylphosphatase [Vagococcus fluvialis]MCM2140137.1 acylphosphatase [Vagococcus fluvialis]MDT2781718.1 acylphosphatase [Vagococcus fluvialis]NKC60006.1 acylphosphatase [Vagococcus fluvialis]NKD50737.1 acylphosphatase [Vagococcus fluvialis]
MMKVAMTVSGKVQGVGFRYTTKMVADQLGVLGIVRNEDNGDVYIEAQGEEKKVNDFIEAVKKSPAPFGRVDQVTFHEANTSKEYTKFSVTN